MHIDLSDSVQMLAGYAFKSTGFTTDKDAGLPLIRIRDLGETNTSCRFVGQYPPNFLIKDGDLLVGMDGEFRVRRWNGGPALLNQRVLKIWSADPDVLNNDYLYYRLQPALLELENAITGTTVKHLSTKDLKRITWEVPPVDEQRHVASILRCADDAIAYANATTVQTRVLHVAETQSVFEHVGANTLTDERRVEGWQRVFLGDVFRERKERGRVGLPVASVSISQGLVLRESLDRRVQSELPPEGHALVREGDIAYNTMRMWQGACGLATADCLISPAYVVMSPTSQIESHFAFHMLRSPPVTRLLHGYSQGIVDDRLRLYPTAFAQIPINLPPMIIQRAIAESFNSVDHFIATARREHGAKTLLRDAMANDLLSGRVRALA